MNYLHEHSTFETVKELNEAVNEHIQRNQYELNETDRSVLLTLSRYSVKYKGVSHLKISTLAEIVGKSDRTIQRSIRKLERLNIVERLEFIRKKSGGHGANIYRILPFNVGANSSEREDDGKPANSSDEETDKQDETINLSSNSNNTLLETEKRAPSSSDDIIKRGLRNALPKPIYDALSPFFNGHGLYNVYGILLRAKAKIDRSIMLETHADRYIDAFYNVIRLHKAGKVRSLNGLLFVTWERLTAEISRQINAKHSELFNDFCAVIG